MERKTQDTTPAAETTQAQPTVTAHRDGKGVTAVYSCGCKVSRRGRSQRMSLCDTHGQRLADGWAKQARDAAVRATGGSDE